MTRREELCALGGGVLGAVMAYGSIRLSQARTAAGTRGDTVAIGTSEDHGPSPDTDAAVDPAMLANANLTESLHECSRQLSALMGDKARLEQELEAEQSAEVDASRSARARRMARREVSQSDWKELANAGTVRYVLPCGSFKPTPEVLDRLGLGPDDVPAIRSAFTAARDAAWAQIRPLCAMALGGAAAADRVGLDSCPQVILDSERTTSPADADSTLRAVGAVKAGLAEPSSIASNDPVGNVFLVLTGVAKDAESHLASVLGPDQARLAVYGDGTCSRTSEFTSSGSGLDP